MKHRILVVEDNVDARESLVALLEAFGHEVQAADSANAALAAVRTSLPGVALVDIGLPDVDGFEVARRLRLIPGAEKIWLIALTGYGSPDDQRRSAESGFDAHLTKPLDFDALEVMLAQMKTRPMADDGPT